MHSSAGKTLVSTLVESLALVYLIETKALYILAPFCFLVIVGGGLNLVGAVISRAAFWSD